MAARLVNINWTGRLAGFLVIMIILRMLLLGHTVAVIPYCLVTKMITTYTVYTSSGYIYNVSIWSKFKSWKVLENVASHLQPTLISPSYFRLPMWNQRNQNESQTLLFTQYIKMTYLLPLWFWYTKEYHPARAHGLLDIIPVLSRISNQSLAETLLRSFSLRYRDTVNELFPVLVIYNFDLNKGATEKILAAHPSRSRQTGWVNFLLQGSFHATHGFQWISIRTIWTSQTNGRLWGWGEGVEEN